MSQAATFAAVPAWLAPPHGEAESISLAIAAMVPAITTARLTLRAPRITDFPAYRSVFTTDRAVHMGGPFTEEAAFADFCEGIAGWMLRGAGMWTLTLTGADTPLGWIYLWQEQGDPAPELGWVLTSAAEGHGYATEAARAVLPHAVTLYGPNGFVSYIDAANPRSARIATALGATRDPVTEAAIGDATLHVFRHSGVPL